MGRFRAWVRTPVGFAIYAFLAVVLGVQVMYFVAETLFHPQPPVNWPMMSLYSLIGGAFLAYRAFTIRSKG
ncbi:MAG: hypothetical protein ACYC96_15405 [Fimbriimonadaceae bacterium]